MGGFPCGVFGDRRDAIVTISCVVDAVFVGVFLTGIKG